MSLGNFIVCANHIGDIRDIPSRTINHIIESDYIFCDFLDIFMNDVIIPNKIDIKNKTIVELRGKEDVVSQALGVLESGKDVVFICDNGMPGFADNGLALIGSLHDMGIKIKVVPGPSIIPAAVAAAGISEKTADIHFMQLFGCSLEEKAKKIENIKDICSLVVILDFQDYIPDLLNFASKSFDENLLAAICVDIGTESQKIIRGRLKDLINKKINLGNAFTEDNCSVTLVIAPKSV